MIRHIADGENFQFDRDFGFHGSAEGQAPKHGANPGYARGGRHERRGREEHMARGGEHRPEPGYAHGGHEGHHEHPDGHHVVSSHHHEDGRHVEHHAHGGHTVHHPDGRTEHHHAHGHSVHHPDGRTEHHHAHGGHSIHHADGMVVHHHAHGGHTVHHPGGMTEHHHADGSVTHHLPDGSTQHHDSSEYAHGGHHMAHRARGGAMPGGEHGDLDAEQDKKMVAKGIHQHEDHEHGGEHTDLHLARGGIVGEHTRIPRSMRPSAEKMHTPIGDEMPINRPPRNPRMSRTPPNAMPGGEMGYGVQPPDDSADVPAMRRGGLHRR